MVVPYVPEDLDKPEPSDGFLEAVQDHVDRHRLLTDRARVVAPTYVGLEIEAEVRSNRWHPQPGGEADVESVVREYIDPIHGYEGDGWPFGRTLYKEELYELLDELEWIDTVQDLSVRARGKASVDSEENVKIDDASLFYLQDIRTEVETITRNGGRGRGSGGSGRGGR